MMDTLLTALANWLHEVFVAKLDWLMLLGLVAQVCFTMRFVVQWLASERAKRSVIPVAFWLFSLVGGGLLFIYSIFRKDPVYILGQGIGVFVYIRNLWLIYRERQAKTR